MKYPPWRDGSRSVSRPLCPTVLYLLLACIFAGVTTASAASSYSLTYSLTDLGTLEGGQSYALVVNASGQVAGVALTPSGYQRAFLYDGSTMLDLGTLGGNHSYAMAINASGQVAGWAQTPSGETHAFLYDGTTMRDLGTLGGGWSIAVAINASGQVVGYAFPPSGGYHAFLYDGATMRDLGTLDGNHSTAMAINASGQVVGGSDTSSGGPHAFLYDGPTMRDLNNLLDAAGDGWTVSEARAINDAGQIAATAYNPDAGSHAVLLTPRITVSIEIEPGRYSERLNPKGHGRIPVAILSARAFDAPAQIDQSSLTFGRMGDESSLAFCSRTAEDVNGDGLPDLVCYFHAQAAAFQNGDTQGTLKGRTVSGISFVGSDSVRIVPTKRWLHSLPRYHRP
jgi:probable HAF family extracellular repeat protein